MDYAFVVRGFEGLGNLADDFECLLLRHGPALDYGGERFARDQLHHQGALAMGFGQSIDDGDVGVIQRR
jgi:hypothetical protein